MHTCWVEQGNECMAPPICSPTITCMEKENDVYDNSLNGPLRTPVELLPIAFHFEHRMLLPVCPEAIAYILAS